MIVTCPRCEARYRYDEARFGGAATKRLKCPKCGEIFQVSNPAGGDALDATSVERGRPSGKTSPPGATTDKLRTQAEEPELPQLAPLPKNLRFSLAVIAGSQAGSVFPISKPRIYLGRGSSMDVQLNDAEVSRKHAMLEIRGEEGTLTDLGSTNGTYVDGVRVERATVTHQKEFTLGSTTLMLLVTPVDEAAV